MAGYDSNVHIQSGQFTAECWVNFETATNTASFLGQWGNAVGVCSWFYFLDAGTLTFIIYDSTLTARSVTVAVGTLSANVWRHFAVDRDGTGKLRLYIDGVMVASGAFNYAFNVGSSNLGIGVIPQAGNEAKYCPGWIDEARFTNGVARYASDSGFTPPSAAFPRS